MANSLRDTKLKNLTGDPGVYLMKDASGAILYVGKAKNLRNRVSSYFQENRDLSPRIQLMVGKIADFEVVLTDNEVEALVLEFNLIKKYRPRFNVVFRDDKSYPYVRLDMGHPFPRMEYVRRVKKDGARYFGPYVSAFQIRDVLQWAQKAFRLRDCSDNEFRNRSRPCILHQMGQCSAPCVGYIDEASYAKNIEQVLKLLDGKNDEVVSELESQMENAAREEKFELAGALRDRIRGIEEINQGQKVLDPESAKSRDVVQFARGGDVQFARGGSAQFARTSGVQFARARGEETARQGAHAVVVVMAVRDGRTVGVFQFPFTDLDPELPDDEFLYEFVTQYYLARHENAPQLLPSEVLLPPAAEGKWEGLMVLSRALGKRMEIRVPKRGEASDLMAMVKKTADYHLLELSTRAANTVEDLIDTQKRLHLHKFPHRLECFDISHFQGEGTVASRVVFLDGKPEKSLYRHYHVETVSGPDDFKSMREILGRRFEAAGAARIGGNALPDLVIVDGGRGQLAQAVAIFDELGVLGVDLVAIAKARTERDFEGVEVKGSMERIFKPNQKNPIALKPGTGAHRLVTQARDEAHRFAITFHRKVRDKRILGKSKR
ncbi:MAG: excinuclease ABC subunit C [Deltaproteobacteria bacterium]|nr:excinuclease ABC subunit C [Deltaproteobacteria bacterium]